MPEIKTEFLFTIALEAQVFSLGNTPYGDRRIFRFDTGSFEGPTLKGRVLPGGGGWSLVRRDNVLEIEVGLTLETDDEEQIYMTWRVLLMAPKEALDHRRSCRRDRRRRVVLFPCHALLRDEFRKVRLVEWHLLDCHWLAHDKRPDAPGVSGAVGVPQKVLVTLVNNVIDWVAKCSLLAPSGRCAR